MLRFLVGFIVCFSSLVIAEPEYVEPDSKGLSDVSESIKNALKSADTLTTDDEFLSDLLDQKKKAKSVNVNSGSDFYDLSGIKPEFDDDSAIRNALKGDGSITKMNSEAWTVAPIILVSFSMPESSIKSLIAEASRIGAGVIIRGAIDGDLPKTIALIRELAGDNLEGGLLIDPTVFKRFNVSTVPTFILPLEPLKSCDQNGCAVPKHVQARGSVSLRYFLEKSSLLGEPEEKTVADKWLAKFDEDMYQ